MTDASGEVLARRVEQSPVDVVEEPSFTLTA